MESLRIKFQNELELLISDTVISRQIRSTPYGFIITLRLSGKIWKVQDSEIIFEVFFENAHAWQPPKIYLLGPVQQVAINDGRDLLGEAFSDAWSPSNTLLQLVESLESLATRIARLSLPEIWDFGIFHIGHSLWLEIWREAPNVTLYSASEVFNTKRKSRSLILVVTPLVILQLSPVPEQNNYGLLLSWQTIKSLIRIGRSKKNKKQLTFEWQLDENPSYTQYLVVEDSMTWVEHIGRNLQKLQKQLDSSNPQAGIDYILNQIEELEESNQNPNKLLQLYQQAVEYYSASGNEVFMEYLEKMKALYNYV